jgi:hypothetical protein
MPDDAPIRFRLRRIDLATARMDALAAFYTEVFGFSCSQRMITGHRHVVMSLGAVEISLAPLEYANVSARAEGVHQLVVEVPSVDALVLRARARGAVAQVGAGSACIMDPDGNPWLFVESAPA